MALTKRSATVTSQPPLSIELFPPRTHSQKDQLTETVSVLKNFSPRFFSVTHGAAGNALTGTKETISLLRNNNCNVAPHITCKIKTRSALKSLIKYYQSQQVSYAVVIKGDSNNSDDNEFTSSTNLLGEICGYCPTLKCAVACYPEIHPLGTVASDISVLKEKEDCGAAMAITQFFYNIDAYKAFLDSIDKHNITIPIVVGVLPIIKFSALCDFAKKCGSEIPRWLIMQMEHYQDDPKSQQQLGIDLVTSLMDAIQNLSYPQHGFHIYSLNQYSVCTSILRNLKYPEITSCG